MEAAKKAAQDVKDKVEPGKSQVCNSIRFRGFSLRYAVWHALSEDAKGHADWGGHPGEGCQAR